MAKLKTGLKFVVVPCTAIAELPPETFRLAFLGGTKYVKNAPFITEPENGVFPVIVAGPIPDL